MTAGQSDTTAMNPITVNGISPHPIPSAELTTKPSPQRGEGRVRGQFNDCTN